jgi:hypothetical protein
MRLADQGYRQRVDDRIIELRNEIIREMGEGDRDSQINEEVLQEIMRKQKQKRDFYTRHENSFYAVEKEIDRLEL